MGTRAAVYCRISKDTEGTGLGTARQDADCRELAERLEWTVVETFTDNDISAYSGKRRPGYKRMLAAIAAGRVDGVLCWHTDRLHRSPVELEDYITACEPRSVPTHCVKAGPLDLASPSGRLVARQLGAVARYEVEHASERIRGQKTRALAAGEWIGGARAFGYESDGVTVRESEACHVRDAARRVLAGESVYGVTRRWIAEGVPTVKGGGWTQRNVRRILVNPRYAGILTHHGTEVGPANWPSVLSEDEHCAVVRVLCDVSRATYIGARTLKWLGSGLYVCGRCGEAMRSASNGRNGRRWSTYRCRTGQHYTIRAPEVDTYVEDVTRAVLRKHGADLLTDDGTDRAGLHERANVLRARMDELEDMLGDEEITRRGYLRQRDKLTAKLDAVTAQLDSTNGSNTLAGVADAADPGAAYDAQPVERRRAIVDTLMTVTIGAGRAGRLPKGVDFDYGRVRIDPKVEP